MINKIRLLSNILNIIFTNYNIFVENKSFYYSDLSLEKKRASNIRTKAFKKLDKLLVDFDTNFSNNGGKLFWANDADDAKQMISDILSQEKVKKILIFHKKDNR